MRIQQADDSEIQEAIFADYGMCADVMNGAGEQTGGWLHCWRCEAATQNVPTDSYYRRPVMA